jgi:hypothetical protein
MDEGVEQGVDTPYFWLDECSTWVSTEVSTPLLTLFFTGLLLVSCSLFLLRVVSNKCSRRLGYSPQRLLKPDIGLHWFFVHTASLPDQCLGPSAALAPLSRTDFALCRVTITFAATQVWPHVLLIDTVAAERDRVMCHTGSSRLIGNPVYREPVFSCGNFEHEHFPSSIVFEVMLPFVRRQPRICK